MDESCGSRARPFALLALRAAVATSILGFGASSVFAQPAPQAIPAEQAAPVPQSPIQPANTPIVESQSTPRPAPEPPPPPAPPGGGGFGPSLIPDGEAPPGPVAPAFPPVIPNIDFAGRLRIGIHTVGTDNPKQISDLAQELSVDMYFAGQLTRYVKWWAGVTGSYTGVTGSSNGPAATGSVPGRDLGTNVQLLDVTARFEFMPELNVYAGRMIVVADRFTPSGPWGMDEYFYTGIIPATQSIGGAPALMRSGPTGRDLGMNVWGAFNLLGGTLKYYLGSYQWSDPALSPLFSGRLQLSLLTPEPGFYQRTTYYGYKDLISIGIGGQYQKNGSVIAAPNMNAGMGMPPAPAFSLITDDYSYLTGDVVVDKRLGDAGTISFVGSGSMFAGDYQPWKSHYQAGVGFLLPGVIGIGKLRPSIRWQGAKANGADGMSHVLDFQIGYVIMPWYARVALGYRWASTSLVATKGMDSIKTNMLFLGITLADP